ncbi:hypothetical protein TBLA_0C03960 [Henningerozyma blattae CBS 6284]|uniref:Nucleoporin NUP60 n=1 Tax=Henningerozyma blattae (strain ATCC 34711 / CBS 6284 / DSM 70876 / NBRC 10599 / NRRL Y-10934 / UCD 77-7) TaxID=1071380 RepID=I2H1E5_HENB6|nr:hypothetical protein TBLA_0C03960 [Tetrapisispora blattae CBS 6284]CCH60197.1 hypothetical protein TBLA_0C03960 [Tetrapisispora blattae CBS 6284]
MPVRQSKSHRTSRSQAPYRGPIIKTIPKKNSFKFLSKLQSLLPWNSKIKQQNTTLPNGKKSNEEPKDFGNITDQPSDLTKDIIETIPGGFFNSNNHNLVATSVKIPKNSITTRRREDIESSSDDSDYYNDDETNVKATNDTLARFFSDKGDRELSEIERAGVIALLEPKRDHTRRLRKMRKISRESTLLLDNNDVSMDNNNSSNLMVLKSSADISSFSPPTFHPSFDKSTDDGSRTMVNTQAKRRVFDYNSLPAPYKTTVYKYSSVGTPQTLSTIHPPASSDTSTSIDTFNSYKSPSNDKNQPPKKITVAASALLTLLDNNSEKKAENNSKLANPYTSSNRDLINKHKVNQTNSRLHGLKDTSSTNGSTLPSLTSLPNENGTPFAGSVTSESKTKINDSIELTAANTKNSQLDSTAKKPNTNSLFGNKSNASTSNSTAPISFDKYKPNKPSSLRSSVVATTPSPEKISHDTKNKNPESPIMKTSSSFNFTFKKQEDSKDEDQSKKNSPLFSVEKIINKQSTPILFSTDTSTTTNTTNAQSKPFSFINEKGENKDDVSKTDITAKQDGSTKPKFSFGQAGLNNTNKDSSVIESTTKPTFSFGSFSDNNKIEEDSSLKNEVAPMKPSFNFSFKRTSDKKENLNNTDDINSSSTSKPSVSFGFSSATNNVKISEKNSEETTDKSKQIFSFGTSPANNTISQPSTTEKKDVSTVSQSFFNNSIPAAKSNNSPIFNDSPTSTATTTATTPTAIATKFDFGNAIASNVDNNSVDDSKVEEYRILFNF